MVDVSAVVTEITDNIVDISLIGIAILTMKWGIHAVRWLRRAVS